MASSDPEIHDGFTLPVWMKTKPSKGFEPFSTSPPAPEDSFFYIRYPKPDALFGKPKLNDEISKIAQAQQKDVAVPFNNINKDWSKHTKPCQDVLHGIAPINTAANPMNIKPKPAGTDDGFKGEGAACGTSVLKVANKMISNRGPRGFTVALPSDDDGQAPSQYNLMARRGSKSLPTTPMHSPPSSPNSRRKMYNNRYFTSPFEPMEDAHSRSWLTMALVGFKKDLTTSTSTLAEEEILENRLQSVSLTESVENLGLSGRVKEPKSMGIEEPNSSKSPKSSQAIRAKPSELREMNFWSPTSM